MKRTKTFLRGLAVSAGVLTLAACGAPADPAATQIQNEEQAPGGQDFSATGYVLRESLVLNPVGEAAVAPFALPAGSELAVLGTRESGTEGTLVHVGLDAEEGAAVPSDLWVPARDLPSDALEPYAPADYTEEGEAADGDFSALKAMTYCYRYVKQYLLQTGQVKVYLPGTSAYQAANILPKHGFRRTGHSPATARNGEVCVYSGGPQGHGHIEVKRNGKWWYGYGFKPNPIQGRRFIACFAK